VDVGGEKGPAKSRQMHRVFNKVPRRPREYTPPTEDWRIVATLLVVTRELRLVG
jgi:hypothetical protein